MDKSILGCMRRAVGAAAMMGQVTWSWGRSAALHVSPRRMALAAPRALLCAPMTAFALASLGLQAPGPDKDFPGRPWCYRRSPASQCFELSVDRGQVQCRGGHLNQTSNLSGGSHRPLCSMAFSRARFWRVICSMALFRWEGERRKNNANLFAIRKAAPSKQQHAATTPQTNQQRAPKPSCCAESQYPERQPLQSSASRRSSLSVNLTQWINLVLRTPATLPLQAPPALPPTARLPPA